MNIILRSFPTSVIVSNRISFQSSPINLIGWSISTRVECIRSIEFGLLELVIGTKTKG